MPLYDAGGKALPEKAEPLGFVVLKFVGCKPPQPSLVEFIAQTLKTHILVLPSNIDIMTGTFAKEAIDDLHRQIHRLDELMAKGKGEGKSS